MITMSVATVIQDVIGRFAAEGVSLRRLSIDRCSFDRLVTELGDGSRVPELGNLAPLHLHMHQSGDSIRVAGDDVTGVPEVAAA